MYKFKNWAVFLERKEEKHNTSKCANRYMEEMEAYYYWMWPGLNCQAHGMRRYTASLNYSRVPVYPI